MFDAATRIGWSTVGASSTANSGCTASSTQKVEVAELIVLVPAMGVLPRTACQIGIRIANITKLDATVCTALGVVHEQQIIFTHPEAEQPLGAQAELVHEIVAYAGGPLLGKPLVVTPAAGTVGMPHEQEIEAVEMFGRQSHANIIDLRDRHRGQLRGIEFELNREVHRWPKDAGRRQTPLDPWASTAR